MGLPVVFRDAVAGDDEVVERVGIRRWFAAVERTAEVVGV
jgi:hypothetical protein